MQRDFSFQTIVVAIVRAAMCVRPRVLAKRWVPLNVLAVGTTKNVGGCLHVNLSLKKLKRNSS